MSTPEPPPARHPLNTAAVIVLVVGLAVTAVLLLAPITAAGSSCGSVLANQDPNIFLGEGACVDALDARRMLAFVAGVLTVIAAGVLAIVAATQKANAKVPPLRQT
jgi:hypothetical protein